MMTSIFSLPIQNYKGHFPPGGIFHAERHFLLFKATFHFLTIFMRGQRATGKIQRNSYHHTIEVDVDFDY